MEVICYSDPYERSHDPYQAYYREGLRQLAAASGHNFTAVNLLRFPPALRWLNRLRESHTLGKRLGRARPACQRLIDRAARLVGGRRRQMFGPYHGLVGQYLFRAPGVPERRVCIDAQDSGEVGSPELLELCDLYFKTNYWRGRDYPAKVVPLCNASPQVLTAGLDHLRSLRTAEKVYDVCCIFRVWGGRNELEGIEHNLRLLEAVARAPGKKVVLAYLLAGDIPTYARRLEDQGIRWSRDPLPLLDLWRVSAQSRLNVIKLGLHSCVPWRMIELLGMGACPALDQQPFTVWPQPLQEGVHYFNLGAASPPGAVVAEAARYDRIPAAVEEILADQDRLRRVSEANALLFDRHLEPPAVGRHVLEKVLSL
jgi:hypothetical protein